MRKHLRAATRAAIGIPMIPVFVAMAALQGFIVGPVFRNNKTIPTAFYKMLGKLFGIKVAFNKASAPLDTGKPTWYVANHQSIADFIVLGSTLKGTFAGKGDVLRWPGVAQMARAVKYIGIRRVKKDDPNFKTFHAQTIGKIMKNFNAGQNTIMFPEGTTTDGSHVAMFRAGLISMLFNEKGQDRKGNDVTLDSEVVVQPVAIKVNKVDGQSVDDNPELLEKYSFYHENNTLKRIWKRLCVRDIEVELTTFDPLKPSDFKDQFELINKAHELVRGVVVPGQTEVKKAVIPGVDNVPEDKKGSASKPSPQP